MKSKTLTEAHRAGETTYTEDDAANFEISDPEAEDYDCDICGVKAETRTCAHCGTTAVVTDCGHRAQPRPIACGDRHGDQLDRMLCEVCASLPKAR